jgi:hypothetical protein
LGETFERVGDFAARFDPALPRFAAAVPRLVALFPRVDEVFFLEPDFLAPFFVVFFRFVAPFPRLALAAARFRLGGARMVPLQLGDPQRQG